MGSRWQTNCNTWATNANSLPRTVGYHRAVTSMKLLRNTLALGAFFVLAVLAAGCGSGVPGNAVADVAGNPITLRAFNHWMYLDAKNIASQQQGAPVVVPTDPPQYNQCVAALRSQIPTLKSTPTKTIRNDCDQQFKQLSSQVLNSLITDYWYQAEAAKQHLTVTNAQVMRTFETAKRAGFPTEAQFQAYLAQTGLTLQDVLFQFRVTALYGKLAAKHPAKVTPAAIQAYYNSHLTQFTTPERRDIRIVLASTNAKALAAQAALKSGKSWSAVAKQYSIDPTSKNNGGLLVGVTHGQQDQALDAAAFTAPVNKLLGPVHGQFGYYVFEVTKIKPTKTTTLAAAAPQIQQTLTTQLQTNAAKVITAQARKDWLSKTTCRAPYIVSSCSGYKKSSASSG
jgi:foldase protein PrsA